MRPPRGYTIRFTGRRLPNGHVEAEVRIAWWRVILIWLFGKWGGEIGT